MELEICRESKLGCLPMRMELERCREFKAMLFTNKNGTREM